ncbi:hypothetical protein [Actinopolymorpha sp. B9G3]|uniref:MmyB family transcriptional regulator n=1 Tax=Actinopolymorpha sp. B9G3 TaxID=3158970 RepID=UPI0032D99014
MRSSSGVHTLTGAANTARFVYLDPASRDFLVDWERAAADIAAILRSEAGRNPHDNALTNLIGELSTRSETFRTRWAAHNVRFHRTGVKKLHHPVVGDLDLNFEAHGVPLRPRPHTSGVHRTGRHADSRRPPGVG